MTIEQRERERESCWAPNDKTAQCKRKFLTKNLTQTNALERENGCANEQGKIVTVDHCQVGTGAIDGKAMDGEIPQINDAEHDKHVADHARER